MSHWLLPLLSLLLFDVLCVSSKVKPDYVNSTTGKEYFNMQLNLRLNEEVHCFLNTNTDFAFIVADAFFAKRYFFRGDIGEDSYNEATSFYGEEGYRYNLEELKKKYETVGENGGIHPNYGSTKIPFSTGVDQFLRFSFNGTHWNIYANDWEEPDTLDNFYNTTIASAQTLQLEFFSSNYTLYSCFKCL